TSMTSRSGTPSSRYSSGRVASSSGQWTCSPAGRQLGLAWKRFYREPAMTGGDYDRFLRRRFPVGVRTIQAFDADGVRAFSCEIWYPAAATYAGEDRRRSAFRNVPADYFLARQ